MRSTTCLQQWWADSGSVGATVLRCGLAALGLAWVGLVVPVQAATSAREPLRELLSRPPAGEVLVVAHRADWRNFPENSLPAIEGSISQGVGMVEVDLQRTKDGHLVLMHDPTVDRTTTGRGKVAELTLQEVKALRLRDGLGSPTPFTVPTLHEALLAARGRVLVNLDKAYRYWDEVEPVLHETGMLGQVLMKGPGTVAEVRATGARLLGKVTYMPVVRFTQPEPLRFMEDWIREQKPVAMELVFSEWTPEVDAAFALCRDHGVRIWVNTLWPHLAGGLADDRALESPDSVYGLLIERGVSLIQTDRPALLQAYLKARSPAPSGRP
jgi:glycerophosphoryl diester phosphodiesterase